MDRDDLAFSDDDQAKAIAQEAQYQTAIWIKKAVASALKESE